MSYTGVDWDEPIVRTKGEAQRHKRTLEILDEQIKSRKEHLARVEKGEYCVECENNRCTK